MSALDTFDSLLMTRAYSWSFRNPARKLYYNIATTGMTVLVAAFVGSVYLAGLLSEHTSYGSALAGYASIGEHFELLGYLIVGLFVSAWLVAFAAWRVGGLEARYGSRR
jgi:high-affinity nickel-transport protein